jgi:hypothetical protein
MKLPTTASEVSDFIGANYVWRKHKHSDTEPHDDDEYCLTAHDLLTAFAEWQEAQPKQEPDDAIRAALRDCLAWGRAYGEAIPARQWDEMREQQIEQHMANLITAPQPQREWVGLTDQDVQDFLGAAWAPEVTPADFIRATEAKLREKNGGQE